MSSRGRALTPGHQVATQADMLATVAVSCQWRLPRIRAFRTVANPDQAGTLAMALGYWGLNPAAQERALQKTEFVLQFRVLLAKALSEKGL